MNTTEKFQISRIYINMYNKYNLEELKDNLEFFINRGCNSNNNNDEEFKLHMKVLKNCIEFKLYEKYN
jgi:hypothetical protein